jgi:hypothetical protein
MTDFLRARTEDLVYRDVDDTVVMLDLRTQHYLSLNESGAELWPLIARGARRDELVDALRDRYGLSDDEATRRAACSATGRSSGGGGSRTSRSLRPEALASRAAEPSHGSSGDVTSAACPTR